MTMTMTKDIHKDYEAIKSVALHYAKEHNANYTVILMNGVDGEFSLENGSTYEYVADSYFEKERPNVKILFRTDDELKHEEIFGTPDFMQLGGHDPYILEYKNHYTGLEALNGYRSFSRGVTYVRETPKIGRNSPCACGSGKKSKKCCNGVG